LVDQYILDEAEVLVPGEQKIGLNAKQKKVGLMKWSKQWMLWEITLLGLEKG